MWLNMCPLVKRRTAIKLMAAHKFLFWRRGARYGAATVKKETKPRIAVVMATIFT